MFSNSTQNRLSYWESSVFLQPGQTLVLGSGIVGLNAALRLRELDPQRPIVVIDRGALPSGASTKNAGFACFGSMTELLDDLAQRPASEVWALVERRFRGLQRLREKLGDQAIRYEALGGYEVFRAEEKAIFEACREQIAAFNREAKAITGLKETYVLANENLPRMGFAGVENLILNRGEGQINTGWMMKNLLQRALNSGIQVLNGVEITQLNHDTSGVYLQTTEGWHLQFADAIVATNGFARRLLPDLPVTPARNQVLVTEPIAHLPFKGCFHYDRGYFYFRDIDGRILLGGGRNLDPQTEQTDEFGHTELIRNSLLNLLETVILPGQKVQVAQWWSGILGLGADKSPIIRKLGPRLTVAVRMGGMGVAIGTLVGEEAAELLLA
jgi:gamma-glutamylputrescine oxidase